MNSDLDPKNFPGLSEAEAAKRLKEEGYNELPSSRQRSIWTIAFEVVREPMFLLLVACGIIYLFLGDVHEALMLLGFVFVVMGITLYQERKTERALEALRDLSSPRALVIRNGAERRIAGREVVRGDILVVKEGDRIPADAVLLSCLSLLVDESLLTGESVPVRKSAAPCPDGMKRPGGDDLPFIYSGTLAVQGQCIAQVQAIGIHTEIGKIGRALQNVEPEESLLQRETGRLVRNLAVLGLSLCALVIVVYGLTRGNWLHGFLAGITLAMATLPEEFPVVLTVFLALGAWRISQKRVLTRRVPAVETLGSATVLCVDKTGTLTENRMTVRKLFAQGEYCTIGNSAWPILPESCHQLAEFSILASQIDPFDPMEKAIRHLGDTSLAGTEHLHEDWTLVHEYALSPELLSMSRVWKSPNGRDYIIAAKGSPEAIIDLCHLDRKEAAELSRHISALADEGLRVLGVAEARFEPRALPDGQHDFIFEFLGLIGLEDPVRRTVPESIQECRSAGIRVVMITGDYPGTARNIARQIGLTLNDSLITGPELDSMSDEELQRRISEVNIFARVVPEQKLRIVEALKANGEIVAMTGDGVNDAPALKSAHIGIAMGGRGTDVARESASLVLLDDDFSSIVQAVRLGRRIFDNIRKAMAYIFAIHVPIAGMSLIPVLFKWPLVLMPVHILFLELIIDPACSIVFENEKEEADVMKRPPRNPGEPLLNGRILAISLLQGVSVLCIILAVFIVSLYQDHGERDARALTFTTLIVANLCLILTNRSWSRTILGSLRSPNPALWWVIGGTLLFLGLVLYIPFLQDLFKFDRLHSSDLWLCLTAGIFSILWFEGLKLFNGLRGKR
ncbi:cation-translocating P-type ATPase [Syntrophus aciditrophicus]|uniref:Cation transport ATPase n=1 Tax=Syntrophus aciditrophicus (strain SB) TaxID=56780 RepID=Q2LYF6_SYNAS|nr:cation-translocating P-type ATPase [Syntrophus aciditrophicus]ABC76000.1 cation transport ATPase [Syntrophus aciditrophicus SB]